MTAVLIRDAVRTTVLEARPRPSDEVVDIVDQWGEHSFPASDPPANW